MSAKRDAVQVLRVPRYIKRKKQFFLFIFVIAARLLRDFIG